MDVGFMIEKSVVAASLFLFSISSFQSFKKIWTYTWVCNSLLSPLAQVSKLFLYF